ncbi:MAG: hypothetical protein K6T75_04460, partial [Acetobacteraceae bacterium]|nr:hypothetical protein [Acetobacteraceae bacterium]
MRRAVLMWTLLALGLLALIPLPGVRPPAPALAAGPAPGAAPVLAAPVVAAAGPDEATSRGWSVQVTP